MMSLSDDDDDDDEDDNDNDNHSDEKMLHVEVPYSKATRTSYTSLRSGILRELL
jgi:hypothetical protein